MSIGRTVYQLAYQISPIILQGGIAQAFPGRLLPIVAITEAAGFTLQALDGKADIDLNQYFAHFEPLAGSTMISNQIGQYPFANQNVAANAIISQPLTVSMMMHCPVKGDDGYIARAATMAVMQQMLLKHNSLGGLYTVLTPACIYSNCILLGLRDVTPGQGPKRQTSYQWDFVKPLITLTEAEKASSDLISKITSGLPV
jgi:hypothetical protein